MRNFFLLCVLGSFGCSAVISSAPDGGTDANALDGAITSTDAMVNVDTQNAAESSTVCAAPPYGSAECSTDTDCAMVAVGCYCGAQPIVGVARSSLSMAARCSEEAARNCLLGCATTQGQTAEDGRSTDDGGVIAVRCERTGTSNRCRTYVR